MKPILIFRHVACEGPGYLADFLGKHHAPYSEICIDRNEAIPESPDMASGLVFMGGGMSVNDDLPWIAQEIRLIRQAMERNMPVLGHCLGGQLISKALGGKITKNPVKEMGWHPVSRVAENNNEFNWFKSAPETFEAFHWHGETFSLPPGATRLLGSEMCANQAFSYQHALAMQCHIEMTTDMVRQWVTLFENELLEPGSHIQSPAEVCHDLQARVDSLQSIASSVYANWLDLVINFSG